MSLIKCYAIGPEEAKKFATEVLRDNFLIEDIVQPGKINFVYTHYDRMMIGAAQPLSRSLKLETYDELRASFFLERREIGIINIGGAGSIKADKQSFDLERLDCLYIGRGAKKVSFESHDKNAPAIYFMLSCPAHQTYPVSRLNQQEILPLQLGSSSAANERTLYKYIHNDGLQSCQLVMGVTVLKEGSVWNTMPPHHHSRRMEVYFYFGLKEDQRVLHLMGGPQETRHLFVANCQAVVSPPWSIHAGCGTSSYSFIWGMAGENKDFSDMDSVAISQLK